MQRAPEGFWERLFSLFPTGEKQVDLARRLGVTQPTIARWKRQDRVPDLVSLARICKESGVSADWLLGLAPTSVAESAPAHAASTAPKTGKAAGKGARPSLVGKALRSTLDVEFDEFEKRLLKVLRGAVRAELEAAGLVPTK